MSKKINKSKTVVVVFCDAAVEEGVFLANHNFASLHNLPILLFVKIIDIHVLHVSERQLSEDLTQAS